MWDFHIKSLGTIIEYVYIERSQELESEFFSIIFGTVPKTKQRIKWNFLLRKPLKYKRDKQAKPNKQHQQAAISHIHISLYLQFNSYSASLTTYLLCMNEI